MHVTELKRCVWDKPENLLALLTTVPDQVEEPPSEEVEVLQSDDEEEIPE